MIIEREQYHQRSHSRIAIVCKAVSSLSALAFPH